MVDKRQQYIQVLDIAKAAENEAIRQYMLAMALAPPEDIPRLLEILNDENDHDVIVTDLLLKAVTGSTALNENIATDTKTAMLKNTGGKQ